MINYTPRIGMEVECIVGNDDPRRDEARTHGQFIIDFGAKFVICEIILWPRIDAITLQFTTLRTEGVSYPGFLAECFRPVVKHATDISCFTQLLVSEEA